MLPENATKNGWQQFFAALCFLAHMCSWPYIFFLSTEGGKVSFAAKAARHQICIVSAPAMFPQNCYKTHSSKGVCCYDKKKLILLDWSYGWSRRICHCSSPTDWISIKSLDIKKKNKTFGFEGWGTAWMIEVHSGYSQDTVWCSAPIGSCWCSLPVWCISWAPDPSRSTDPWPPHRHWDWERADAHVIWKFRATLINWEKTKEEQKWRGHITRNPILLYESILYVSQLKTSSPVQKHHLLTLNWKSALMKYFQTSETWRL